MKVRLGVLRNFTESDGTGPEAVGAGGLLGAGCWSSSLQCTVERHAIGHRCRRRCMLSSSSSHRALSLSHCARRRRRAVPSCHAPRRHRTPSSLSPCVVVSPRPALLCTVAALSCHCRAAGSAVVVSLRCRLPPSSLLCRLHRRAVGCCRRGAIGRRRRTVFASPGPPPSPLGVAMPCTHLAAPLCHPAASVCVVPPLCAAVVVVRGACALRGWRPFSGTVPGPWACRWGGGEGAAGAPCVWRAWLSSSRCAVVVSRDRCRALVRDTWALQPGGGWLRGVALAPPDCGGSCALWWALVVAARAVGRWAIGTARLCAAPGPLGPVDGGRRGCVGCAPIAFAVAVSCRRGRRWYTTGKSGP